MEILILNRSEVRELLPMGECIDAMAGAFVALARGEAVLPLRPVMWLPEKVGALGMMPAYLAGIEAMGLKVVSVFPGNHGTEYPSHQGAVLLFEARHGQFLAVIEAGEVTAIRTAAVSGLATRMLAREDAGDIAILGSGVEARSHLEAMLVVRNAKRVRVWSRNEEHAREFAARES
ncbi:MAG: ornithine cyclodeaminase family protein, partial [Acidobacteria bacterium]